MAIITCPECGREVSNKAASCPNCGAPINNSSEKKFCIYCGEQIDKECVVCPKCGKQIEMKNSENFTMKKEKGGRLKTVLIVFAVLIILGGIGSAFDNKSSETNNESSSTDETVSPKESGNNESSSETLPDTSANTESTDDNPLGFNVAFSDTYRNDVTGNWRLAEIAEDIHIEEYALDYYNSYFESDSEIHIVINFTLNTTTRISVMGNLLDVSIMEYVDKEEHDAKLACSGMLLKEYHVNIDTGEIEEIQ